MVIEIDSPYGDHSEFASKIEALKCQMLGVMLQACNSLYRLRKAYKVNATPIAEASLWPCSMLYKSIVM